MAAYRARRYDMSIAVCNQWEAYRMRTLAGDDSYPVIRAASLLKLGRFGEADKDVERATRASRDHRFAADRALDKLAPAVRKRDKTYELHGPHAINETFISLTFDYE